MDLVTHAKAMCAKMLVTLTKVQQQWKKMALNYLEYAKIWPQGGKWRNLLTTRDKIMAPNWAYLIIKEEVGEFLKKCKSVSATLEWGGFK